MPRSFHQVSPQSLARLAAHCGGSWDNNAHAQAAITKMTNRAGGYEKWIAKPLSPKREDI